MLAEEKLVYPIELPINSKGVDNFIKRMDTLDKKINTNSKSMSKLLRNAQAAVARINWGATGKPSTLGRTMTNIMSKNVSDFSQPSGLQRIGANIGEKFGRKKWGADMAAEYAEKYQMSRLAKGKSITTPTAMKGVDVAAGKGMAAAGAKGASMGIAAAGAIVSIAALLAILVPLIVASSRMLQRTLGNITKYLLMFLRPIGDMLAVIFYPLMMILRPLAMLINTMIRPYLQTARQWYRLGLQTNRQAKEASNAGFDTDTVASIQNMATYYFNQGTSVLGLGFSSLFTEIIANVSGGISSVLLDLFSLIPGFESAAQQTKARINDILDAWKTSVQNNNLVALYKNQQELAAAKSTVTQIGSWINLVIDAKNQGLDYQKIIEDTAPKIQTVAEVLKTQGSIAANAVALAYTNSISLMLQNTGLLGISTANDNFIKMFDNIQTKINKLTGNDNEKTGNVFTQLAGVAGGIGISGLQGLAELTNASEHITGLLDKSYKNAKLLAEGYGSEQVFLGQNMYKNENAIPTQKLSSNMDFGSIDTTVLSESITNMVDNINTNTITLVGELANTANSAYGTSLALDTNTASALVNSQKQTETVDILNKNIMLFINDLTKNTQLMSSSMMMSINIMNSSMLSFSSTLQLVISAMYAALARAEAAAKSAAASAASAASSASSAAKSASSSSSSSTKGTKAIGGAITENGIYYLHKGETVVNPVSSSFSNSSSGESSTPSIEFNNCTFGGFADWKKEMDKYFNTQMRHIR
jgi:hypothetical protein